MSWLTFGQYCRRQQCGPLVCQQGQGHILMRGSQACQTMWNASAHVAQPLSLNIISHQTLPVVCARLLLHTANHNQLSLYNKHNVKVDLLPELEIFLHALRQMCMNFKTSSSIYRCAAWLLNQIWDHKSVDKTWRTVSHRGSDTVFSHKMASDHVHFSKPDDALLHKLWNVYLQFHI